jgi:2-oxoglutarate dehydrogenase E2 component (dihydrolipoamide succinyltransferase)
MKVEDAKASTYASGAPSPSAAKILAEKGINPADVKWQWSRGKIN